jgi:hypothetical protein
MGRYVARSGWAEQKTSRESCCGKTAIHHTCQPEFRRAKNCSFALRGLGQDREAKRVRRSLPVSSTIQPQCEIPMRRDRQRYRPDKNVQRSLEVIGSVQLLLEFLDITLPLRWDR